MQEPLGDRDLWQQGCAGAIAWNHSLCNVHCAPAMHAAAPFHPLCPPSPPALQYQYLTIEMICRSLHSWRFVGPPVRPGHFGDPAAEDRLGGREERTWHPPPTAAEVVLSRV